MRVIEQTVGGLILLSAVYLILRNAQGANAVIKSIGEQVSAITTVAQGR